MSSPTTLLVYRYRAFAAEARLPLRPLTLVYGRNNSGKSALLRALAIIAASIQEHASSAFVCPPEIDREGTFQSWAWQGEAGDYSFDLGLCWDDGDLREARFTLDGVSGRAPYVKELQLRGVDQRLLWAGRAPPNRPLRPQSPFRGAEVSFVGLVPSESRVEALQLLRARLFALRGRVRWLDSVRLRPPRSLPRTGHVTGELKSQGQNAASILLERPELIDRVKRFYAALSPPRDLFLQEELNLGHRIRLDHRSGFAIDLVDTGEGMAQVLPVLVAAALGQQEGAGTLLAIEEPESHLHPDAQAVLAKHLCTLAATESPPTLVLETHSRVFLLGVQLAVAGGLPAERVGLVWVDQDAAGRSTLTPIELDPSGHPSQGWPISALSDDIRLAAQLAKLDLQRMT